MCCRVQYAGTNAWREGLVSQGRVTELDDMARIDEAPFCVGAAGVRRWRCGATPGPHFRRSDRVETGGAPGISGGRPALPAEFCSPYRCFAQRRELLSLASAGFCLLERGARHPGVRLCGWHLAASRALAMQFLRHLRSGVAPRTGAVGEGEQGLG